MELPDELLALVHDFSRPVTRPDWRHLHRLTTLDLHIAIARRVNRRCPKVIRLFVSYPPGEYTFNVVNGPKVRYLYTRGPGYPIRV